MTVQAQEETVAFDTYISETASSRLWDGTSLYDLETPRHDLGRRERPYPQQRNYFYATAIQGSARWLQERVAPPQAVYERLLRENVAGFMSWTYPDATPAQIRALSDFHNWSVWMDDQIDRRCTLDNSLSACSLFESLGTTALAPFDDFLARMRDLGMTDSCADRFVQAMRQYGTSSRTEVDAREGRVPFDSVADYITNRRISAAVPVYFPLMFWIARIDLPEEIHQHPIVQRLGNCANDYVSFYNDVGSFAKEHLAGRSDGTFVKLLSEENGLTVQEALHEIADMAAAAADDLETTSDRIEACDLPLQQREQIHRYAEALRKFVGGTNHWSNNTCRYLIGQTFVDTAATSRRGDTYGLR